jgi:hypothetical protein
MSFGDIQAPVSPLGVATAPKLEPRGPHDDMQEAWPDENAGAADVKRSGTEALDRAMKEIEEEAQSVKQHEEEEELLELGEGSKVAANTQGGGGKGSMLVLTISATKDQRSLIQSIPPILCGAWRTMGLCESNTYVANSCAKECGEEADADQNCAILSKLTRASLQAAATSTATAKEKHANCKKMLSALGTSQSRDLVKDRETTLGESLGEGIGNEKTTDQPKIAFKVTVGKENKKIIQEIPTLVCDWWQGSGLCRINDYVATTCQKECSGGGGASSKNHEHCGYEKAAVISKVDKVAAELKAAKAAQTQCEAAYAKAVAAESLKRQAAAEAKAVADKKAADALAAKQKAAADKAYADAKIIEEQLAAEQAKKDDAERAVRRAKEQEKTTKVLAEVAEKTSAAKAVADRIAAQKAKEQLHKKEATKRELDRLLAAETKAAAVAAEQQEKRMAKRRAAYDLKALCDKAAADAKKATADKALADKALKAEDKKRLKDAAAIIELKAAEDKKKCETTMATAKKAAADKLETAAKEMEEKKKAMAADAVAAKKVMDKATADKTKWKNEAKAAEGKMNEVIKEVSSKLSAKDPMLERTKALETKVKSNEYKQEIKTKKDWNTYKNKPDVLECNERKNNGCKDSNYVCPPGKTCTAYCNGSGSCSGSTFTGYTTMICVGHMSCQSRRNCKYKKVKPGVFLTDKSQKFELVEDGCDAKGAFRVTASTAVTMYCGGGSSCQVTESNKEGLSNGWSVSPVSSTVNCIGAHSCRYSAPKLTGKDPTMQAKLMARYKATKPMFGLKEARTEFVCTGIGSCSNMFLDPQHVTDFYCSGRGSCEKIELAPSGSAKCDFPPTNRRRTVAIGACRGLTYTINDGRKLKCDKTALGDGVYDPCYDVTVKCNGKPCQVECIGTGSCHRFKTSGDGWMKPGSYASCVGSSACQHAELTHVTKCEGDKACYGAKMSYAGACTGRQACAVSVIANTASDFGCSGSQACMDSRVTCQGGHCNLKCSDLSVIVPHMIRSRVPDATRADTIRQWCFKINPDPKQWDRIKLRSKKYDGRLTIGSCDHFYVSSFGNRHEELTFAYDPATKLIHKPGPWPHKASWHGRRRATAVKYTDRTPLPPWTECLHLSGSHMKVEKCDPSKSTYLWDYDPATGHLKQGQKCVTAPSDATGSMKDVVDWDGMAVTLSTCDAKDPKQKWDMNKLSPDVSFAINAKGIMDSSQQYRNFACSGAKVHGFSAIDCSGTLSCTSRASRSYDRLQYGKMEAWTFGADVLDNSAAAGCHAGYTDGSFAWKNCDAGYDFSFRASNVKENPIQLSCSGIGSCSNNGEPTFSKSDFSTTIKHHHYTSHFMKKHAYMGKDAKVSQGWSAGPLLPEVKCSGAYSCVNNPPVPETLKYKHVYRRRQQKLLNSEPSQLGHRNKLLELKWKSTSLLKMSFTKGLHANLTCGGKGSCSKMTTDAISADANCISKNTCNGMNFPSTWNVKCSGKEACNGVEWTKHGGQFDCTGDDKCVNATMICEHKPCSVSCKGSRACERATLSGEAWSLAQSTATCDGYEACKFAQIQSVDRCSGERACYGAKLEHINGAGCVGREACKEAVIASTATEHVCKGQEACMDAEMSCLSPNCNILCGDAVESLKDVKEWKYMRDKWWK